MNGLHVGLEAMLTRRDGAVDLAGDPLDGLGEGRVVLGLPGTDELAAVVGLPRCLAQIDPAALQVGNDSIGEQVGIREAQDVGIAQE